jgi:hypothetical protein
MVGAGMTAERTAADIGIGELAGLAGVAGGCTMEAVNVSTGSARSRIRKTQLRA